MKVNQIIGVLLTLTSLALVGCLDGQAISKVQVDETQTTESPATTESPTIDTQVPETKPPKQTAKLQADAKKELSTSEDADLLHKKTVREGIQFLLEKGQAEDGSFSKQVSPAVTGLCTLALIENKVPVTDERVQKALKFVESHIQSDGGIYPKGSNLRNYETSVAVMCLVSANVEGKYDATIKKAVAFLGVIQWDAGERHSIDSNHFGGLGYGSHKRPDMSNTSFFQDAMIKAGIDPKSQAFRNSVTFMSRGQNLSSTKNTAQWAKVVTEDDKGGFIYTPVGEGESKAGKTDAGGLRSYASMTYAGLKSLLYAGVNKDDIRVQAAMDWIGRHYDLTTNPGMGQQGLFYYYNVFAKTLDASKLDFVVDKDGKSNNWRADLVRQLASVQAEDGSWTNPADRWYEGDPNLVTAYAMLALSYCNQPSQKRNQSKPGDSRPK